MAKIFDLISSLSGDYSEKTKKTKGHLALSSHLVAQLIEKSNKTRSIKLDFIELMERLEMVDYCWIVEELN